MVNEEKNFSAQEVVIRAQALRDGGADVNQVADLLARADAQAANYGIGIILDGHGRPMPTSTELMAQTLRAGEAGAEAEVRSLRPVEAGSTSLHGYVDAPTAKI